MTPILEIAVLAGAESKAWLVNFTKQVDRLEKIMGGKAVQTKGAVQDDADEETETEVETDDDFTPTPKTKKAATKKAVKQASFDEDEETEDVEETEDDETEEIAPAKKAKAKKITVDDINDACKAYAKENGGGKDGRTAVLKILKKNFKTESISALDPADYPKVMKLLTT